MLTKQELINAVLSGALNAAKQYLEWSEDSTIHDSGIEMFVTAEIGRKLIASGKRKRERHYVWFEAPFSDVQKNCMNESRRGRKQTEFEGNARADLVYFNRTGTATAVIEVKRYISFSAAKEDIKRVAALLIECGGQRGCLKYGLILGMRDIELSARKKPEEILEDLRLKAMSLKKTASLNVESRLKRISLRKSIKYGEGGTKGEIVGSWAGCLCFSHKRAG